MSADREIAALKARVDAQDDVLRRLLDLMQREHFGGKVGADEIRAARAELQDGSDYRHSERALPSR